MLLGGTARRTNEHTCGIGESRALLVGVILHLPSPATQRLWEIQMWLSQSLIRIPSNPSKCILMLCWQQTDPFLMEDVAGGLKSFPLSPECLV